MRILHICQRDDPDTGGSLRVAEALVREQRREGIDAWLLFLYGSAGEISNEFGTGTCCLGLDSSKEAFMGILKLRLRIWRIKPDVIHFHDGIIWPRISMILCRTPAVMHTHLPVSPARRSLGHLLVKQTTKLFLGISLHTIDSWLASKIRPSRMQYTPNGVDFDRFYVPDPEEKMEVRVRLGLPQDKKILLWVGRLHREMKGSDRVERITQMLPDDYVLVVVGNGPEYEGMLSRRQSLINAEKLIMVGSVGVPELYYRASDRFLFTSYHEPFGLVILEAVASGLPVIAFPVTQGGGAVDLLQAFDATELPEDINSETLGRILNDEGSSRDELLSKRALAIKSYSWSALNQRVVDAYHIASNGRVFR